jgi:hypothetical protein
MSVSNTTCYLSEATNLSSKDSLIDRLMKQVERVLVANQLSVVTKEVVETARKNLIIGFE